MGPSLRDRKQQRTRQAVVDAAVRLFAERGYAAVTVADIAAAADVAPRTFFRLFGSKDDVVFAGDDEVLAVLADAADAAPADAAPLTVMRGVCVRFADWAEERRGELVTREALIAVTPTLAARDALKRAQIEELLAYRLAGRLGVGIDDDLRPRLYAKLAVACFQAAYRVALRHDRPLREELERAFDGLPGRDG